MVKVSVQIQSNLSLEMNVMLVEYQQIVGLFGIIASILVRSYGGIIHHPDVWNSIGVISPGLQYAMEYEAVHNLFVEKFCRH